MTTISRKKTKASQVFEQLRHNVITGAHQPGEKLQMAELSERYAVGYSPLREALSRLAMNGLIEVEEQCGFKVTHLSLNEFYDLYNVRMHIESIALDYSLQHGDAIWEAEVVAAWHQYKKFLQQNSKIEAEKWNEYHNLFRNAIVKACQSPWLLKIRLQLQEHASRYRAFCFTHHSLEKKKIIELIKNNDSLVAAIIDRDKKKAQHLLEVNWQDSMKTIADVLKKITAK